MNATLQIDLSDLEIRDVEVLTQEGSRGLPEFAASCHNLCHVQPTCSCTVGQID